MNIVNKNPRWHPITKLNPVTWFLPIYQFTMFPPLSSFTHSFNLAKSFLTNAYFVKLSPLFPRMHLCCSSVYSSVVATSLASLAKDVVKRPGQSLWCHLSQTQPYLHRYKLNSPLQPLQCPLYFGIDNLWYFPGPPVTSSTRSPSSFKSSKQYFHSLSHFWGHHKFYMFITVSLSSLLSRGRAA